MVDNLAREPLPTVQRAPPGARMSQPIETVPLHHAAYERTSRTRCRSSPRARCPTCATASSPCSGASSTRCTTTPPAPRRPLPEVRGGRRRGDGQVPPARRHARSTTRWCAWRRTSRCATRWSTAQGNFGSLDGDPPAAMRYTECRLARDRRWSCSPSSSKKTVDFRANYDGTHVEPIVLPARIPAAAGQRHRPASRSAWRRTSRRTTSARSSTRCVALIDEPRARGRATCCKHVKGPDFPTGGQILTSSDELREIYEDGQGSDPGPRRVQARGDARRGGTDDRHHVDPVRGRTSAKLVEKIGRGHRRAEAAAARSTCATSPPTTCASCSSSSRTPTRARDGVPVQAHRARRRTFRVNLTCLVPGRRTTPRSPRPERLRPQGDPRALPRLPARDRPRAGFEYELEQLRKRIHILEGFANDLRRPGRGDPHHPRERGQGGRRREADRSGSSWPRSRPTRSSSSSSTGSPSWRSTSSATSSPRSAPRPSASRSPRLAARQLWNASATELLQIRKHHGSPRRRRDGRGGGPRSSTKTPTSLPRTPTSS